MTDNSISASATPLRLTEEVTFTKEEIAEALKAAALGRSALLGAFGTPKPADGVAFVVETDTEGKTQIVGATVTLLTPVPQDFLQRLKTDRTPSATANVS